MNKEQAEVAFERAKQFLAEGKLPFALKYALKSNRLHATPAAAALAERVRARLENLQNNTTSHEQSNGNHHHSSSTSSSNASHAHANVRQRKAAGGGSGGGGGGGGGATPAAAANSPADVIVKAVLSAKSHYGVLGLDENNRENITEIHIKKAYRVRALKCHPDKCSVTGAEEAFKKISAAYTTLSDANSRAHYDRYGEDDSGGRSGAGARGHPFGGGGARYAREMSPEDIFAAFFGGGAFNADLARRRGGNGGFRRANGPFGGNAFFFGGEDMFRRAGHQQRRQTQTEPVGLFSFCMQLAPLIVFFLFTIISILPSGSYGAPRSFSLHPTNTYNVPFTTGKFTDPPNLKFYVSSSFDREFSLNKKQKIYRDVASLIERNCENEIHRVRQYMHYNLWKGKYEHTRRSKSIPTPNCEQLNIKI